MESFSVNLDKYAALAVEVGVNVQPGQMLVISAPLFAAEYVRKVVRRAYEVGARYVHVEWVDDTVTRTRFELAPADSFKEYQIPFRARGWEEMAADNAAFLSITGADPDLLQGIDPDRVHNNSKATSKALEPYRKYVMTDGVSWSIVAVPSQSWADKVFAQLPEAERIPALWEAIFRATRIDRDDPVQAWREHTVNLDRKSDYLNAKKYKALHYTAPGTDLTIELPAEHYWVSAESYNTKGTAFMANMPTEEVFTVPLKTGVNGTVASTKPLSYGGNLIDRFSVTFKDGRIVDYKAEQGYDALHKLIETDEGSHFLGEVALVPHQSPISETNLIFFNTLFDENASNHLAIGKGYAFCIDGGKHMSDDQLEALGVNDSLTHVDFMIGSTEMDIDGLLADGTREPIFRGGNWAF